MIKECKTKKKIIKHLCMSTSQASNEIEAAKTCKVYHQFILQAETINWLDIY